MIRGIRVRSSRRLSIGLKKKFGLIVWSVEVAGAGGGFDCTFSLLMLRAAIKLGVGRFSF